jgi:hypothetical protein
MKLVLLPVAIAAFLLFLLVLGAIGFGVAFAAIALVGRVWRLLSRSGRPRHS